MLKKDNWIAIGFIIFAIGMFFAGYYYSRDKSKQDENNSNTLKRELDAERRDIDTARKQLEIERNGLVRERKDLDDERARLAREREISASDRASLKELDGLISETIVLLEGNKDSVNRNSNSNDN